jgi:hypothetical protein
LRSKRSGVKILLSRASTHFVRLVEYLDFACNASNTLIDRDEVEAGAVGIVLRKWRMQRDLKGRNISDYIHISAERVSNRLSPPVCLPRSLDIALVHTLHPLSRQGQDLPTLLTEKRGSRTTTHCAQTRTLHQINANDISARASTGTYAYVTCALFEQTRRGFSHRQERLLRVP